MGLLGTQERSISIFGKNYKIRTNEVKLDLNEVCQFVERQFCETSEKYSNHGDTEKAILAAIQISIDYFALRKEKDDLKNRIRQDSERLLHLIDSKIELLAETPATH